WEQARALRELTPSGLRELIFDSAMTKIEVVAADERDGGRREILNLGHTVGHAIETATGYGRYRHGEAIGLGLLAALRLSGADALREEVRGLLEHFRLPVAIEPARDGKAGLTVNDIVAATRLDKKRNHEGVRF